ncbi:MAG: 2-C-methyl-D-erythritol 2,4-cyclodiphosphate synthase [Chloroflexota bacterium]|nr:2-C-methyl-D-erythritol 2,4-cyclodiphosphate synthase [Chloroflexota bacterium]
MTELAGILVAAGRSRRMGTDKLWVDLFGRPVWRWSLDALLLAGVTRVALVVPESAGDRFRVALTDSTRDRCILVTGGRERADSVLAGLSALGAAGFGADTLVLVHDGARPAAGSALVERVLGAAGKSGAVVPVLPVSDSLKRLADDGALDPVDRRGVVAAQTPQLARAGDVRAALVAAAAAGRAVTDEASALVEAGIEVRTVPGEPWNVKLTEPTDELLLRAVLRHQLLPSVTGSESSAVRAGVGFDAHRLVPGGELWLGGLAWPNAEAHLEGHSDGDVVLHAVIDALLGAAGMGDIGTLFPPDSAPPGVDSAELLRVAAHSVASAGWQPLSLDLTIAAAAPRIAPRRNELSRRVAGLLGLEAAAVGVKGTTTDGLGFPGSEGIAAWAIALLRRAE